jgi:hypothetical protein
MLDGISTQEKALIVHTVGRCYKRGNGEQSVVSLFSNM